MTCLRALTLGLLLCGLLPLPSAQAGSSSQFLGANVSVAYPLDVEALNDTSVTKDFGLSGTVPQGSPLPVAGLTPFGCVGGGNHYHKDAREEWFRFREDQAENGCLELRQTIPIPFGAQRFQVHFQADRVLHSPFGDNTNTNSTINAVQQLIIYRENNNTLSTASYYDPGSASQYEAKPFEVDTVVPEGERQIQVAWFFWDRAAPTIIPTSAVIVNTPVNRWEFSATVREASVVFSGAPIQTESSVTDEGVSGQSVRQVTRVGVPVPQPDVRGASEGLEVRVGTALSPVQVRAPDGQLLAGGEVQIRDQQGERTLSLTPDVVIRHGYGTYAFEFYTLTPLTPSAPMIPFAGFLMILPLVLGVYAVNQGVALRRRAVGFTVTAARNFMLALVGVSAVYLASLTWVVAGQRWALILSFPVQTEAAVLDLLLLACAGVFFTLAFLRKRQLVAVMEMDLAQKARATAELERSNRELQQFAYVASHDLQEPLRMVASYTQLLQRRYQGKLGQDADEFIGYAVGGAVRMQTLINDLLTYSRVSQATRPMAPVDLSLVLDTALLNLKVAKEEAKATVARDRLPEVIGDRGQLVQLLQNLLGNAFKFRKKEGPCQVKVTAVEANGQWTIGVQDNGIGIERQYFDRLFVIFQRLHARDEYDGTGIGLAVCKKIVERHAGRIWVQSEPGKGSTFFFTMPAPPGKRLGD